MEEFNCELEYIDPSKIIDKSKHNDLDNFFLVLGVIYNDLKGLITLNDLFKNNYKKPEPGKINAHNGEYSGMQIQINKISIALISEFLITLQKNKKLFKTINFQLIEKKLNVEVKHNWKNILSIALKENRGSNDYLSNIAEVRSNVVYHYDHSGNELRKSFIKKFFNEPKDGSNKKAYFSFGKTMKQTRFFYCDAVLHEYLNSHLKNDTINSFEKTFKLIKETNQVIVNLLKNYLYYKNSNLLK